MRRGLSSTRSHSTVGRVTEPDGNPYREFGYGEPKGCSPHQRCNILSQISEAVPWVNVNSNDTKPGQILGTLIELSSRRGPNYPGLHSTLPLPHNITNPKWKVVVISSTAVGGDSTFDLL
jgi:hypothetical protein